MNKDLRLRQICLFLIAFTPVIRFFTLPSVLAGVADEDMWLCSVTSIILDFLTICPLIYLFKNTDKDFYSLLKERFGDTVAKIIFSLYAVYFLLKSLLPVFEQKDYVELTLYNTFPSLLNFAPLFLVMLYFSAKRLRVIGRASDVIWLTTVIGVVVLIGLSLASVDFGALLPVGARGIGANVKGALKSLNWFGDGAYLLFFVGKFKWEKHGEIKIILSFFAAALTTVLFNVCFYGVFKSIAFRQQFPLTEMSKYSSVADTLGRFDYIGIFLLLFSSFFAVSMPVYFACHAIVVAFKVKKRYVVSLVITAVIFVMVLTLNERVYSLNVLITEKMTIPFIVFGNLIPALCPILLIKRKKLKNEIA